MTNKKIQEAFEMAKEKRNGGYGFEHFTDLEKFESGYLTALALQSVETNGNPFAWVAYNSSGEFHITPDYSEIEMMMGSGYTRVVPLYPKLSPQSAPTGTIGRSAAEAILDSIASISACMTSSPRDWSIDHRDAWMWGIVRGWDDDSMAELVAKHKWSPAEVIRLQLLHQAFNPKPANINDFAKIIIASNGQQVLFLKEIDDGENVLTGLVQYPGYQAKIGYRGISDANFEEILMTLTVKDADKLVDECRFESLGSGAS